MTHFTFYRCVFFLALVLVLAPASDYSQTQTEETEQTSKVITDLVSVPVVVLDQKGRRVPGLARSDFSLNDNGQPMTPAFFSAGAGPVAVVFAIDDSQSVRELVDQQQTAALSLLARFGGNTQVAVLRFGGTPQLALPFTADRETLRNALTASGAAAQRTAIFDAAMAAVKTLDQRPGNRFERRLVVLLSDGLDTASQVKPRAVTDAARAAGVSFYVVHLPLYTVRDNSLVPRSVAKGFRELGAETGGMFLAGPKMTKSFTAAILASGGSGNSVFDLDPLLQAIEDDLNGQYVIAYYADAERAPGTVHHVEVRLNSAGRKDLSVQVLRGDFTITP